jgi:hypothetical protein
MTFAEILYAVTGAFGWLIIALAVVALGFVLVAYARTALLIQREQGWTGLWQAIRVNVLTRKPRR